MLDFSVNLLSVSAITKDSSVFVQFSTNTCIIPDKYSLKRIGSAKLFQGLYILDPPTDFPANTSVCAIVGNKASLWHQRLDHSSAD